MRILPSGDKAVLLDCADASEAKAWAHRLAPHVPVTLGAQTVLVHASTAQATRLVHDLAEAPFESVGEAQQHHVISVHYDGPDLALVAEHTQLSIDDIISIHTSTTLSVGFSGFAPGFAYLTEGDSRLQVPRLEVPRPRVPAGSVALAGVFSGIYPRESAGGWLIIGRTHEWLWDIERDQPARLMPGDTVRFEAS